MFAIHPFATLATSEFKIDHSAGDYLVSTNDGTYLDAISGLYNCPLGYESRSIKEAICNAVSVLPSSHIFSIYPGCSQTNTYLEEFKNELSLHIPFAKCIFLTNSGSEANDSALSLCKLVASPGKHKIMGYSKGYHGCTSSTINVSGNLADKDSTSIFVDFYAFHDSRTSDEYLDYIESQIILNDPDTILAFIAEPMIGAGGGFFMKENILPRLKSLLNKYEIKLILDEVVSGFGRLGTMFAFEKYNVIPDALVVSKAITNGYLPMACCITSFEVHDKVPFGFTTAGNPAACAAATTTTRLIKKYVDSNLIHETGSYFYEKLLQFGIDEKCYKIDHEGMYFSLHFSKTKTEYNPYPMEENIGGSYVGKLLELGIIARGTARSLIIAPGYLMEKQQLDHIAKTVSIVL